jgi:TPR repeat protein
LTSKGISLYESGDFEEAYKIFLREAMKNRDSEAQLYLGMMYEAGDGVEESRDKAIEWYRKAHRQNNLDAGFRMQSLQSTVNCRC